jgi:hypothetical protein
MRPTNPEKANPGGYLVPTLGESDEQPMIGIAGIYVRHKLIPQKLIIEGFVIEDRIFNQGDFIVEDCEISYKNVNDMYQKAFNEKIYPKLIIDGKRRKITDYVVTSDFEVRTKTGYRYYKYYVDENVYLTWVTDNQGELGDYSDDKRYNYYLFENAHNLTPSCVAEKVYILCKYNDGDLFKFKIYDFHEIEFDA